ncbi:energy transducer TonB family protein [Acinetobacter shaoyimingii]|nr:energy transducer TonB [Acinetobacter shaoyimingii]
MMKSKLCFTLMLCLAATSTYSKENINSKKLATQISTAEPAHLTTRIDWVKFPQFQYDDADLNDRERHAIVRIKADENGKVTHASIQESTGVKKLDQILLKAVYAAKTKPFSKNGNTQSLIGYQTFSFKPDQQQSENNICYVNGLSKNWDRQQKDKSVGFEYVQAPQIEIEQDLLKNQDRSVKVKFEVDKQGKIHDVDLKKLSGVNELDQKVVDAVTNSQVRTQRSARTLWIYKKSTLTDTIQFSFDSCK